MIKRLKREACVWNQLNDPNVLPLLGISNDVGVEGSPPALITPLCTNGHVLNYLSHTPDASRLKLVSCLQCLFEITSFLYTGYGCCKRLAIFTYTECCSW